MAFQKKKLSERRSTLIFKTVSVAVPFVFLALLECGLRLFHYGADFRLFTEYPADKKFLYLNPDASKRYFLDQKNATTGNVEPFLKRKAPGTRRIFVLGESTTIGYPYFHNGSFHRWLQYRLAHSYPDANFEIVNLALTAVNSYTVSGFAEELVDYEPDAVLIYTGHNEYYGAMGVGSAERIAGSPWLVRALLRLRGLRTMQLAADLFSAFRQIDSTTGTRMERMVADQQVTYQSEAYANGIGQFRSNMERALAALHQHHIPVLISNLVSNEKDMKPFTSVAVDGKVFPGFERSYNAGVQSLVKGDSAAAYVFFKKANGLFKGHAECNYYLGRLEYARGHFREAAACFSTARDLDGLRFRAPEELNGVIGLLAAKYSGAILVDTRAVFRANSPGGIVGDELMLEHVHPNLRGYALMSEAFFQALKRAGLLPTAVDEMSFSNLLQTMPISPIDSLAGIYKVTRLKSSWPFKGAMRADTFRIESFEEETAYALANRKLGWDEAMNEAYNHYIARGDYREARKVVESLILEQPGDARYYMKSAMLSGQMHREDEALVSLRKSFQLAPSFESARYLFVLYLKKDQPRKALPYLDYAIQTNTSGVDLAPVRLLTRQVIALQGRMQADPADPALLNGIAAAYYRMDNREGALRYARKSLALNIYDTAALKLMQALGERR